MLVFLLVVVVLGLVLFFINLMKEIKNGNDDVVAVPIVTAASPVPANEFIELKALYAAAAQKITTLEKMIEEKNAQAAQFQKESPSLDDHNAQVESLKNILQQQIESLKEQNKALKEELGKALEENMTLQAKVFAHDTRQAGADPAVKVAYVEPPPLLQDVFSPDKQKNQY